MPIRIVHELRKASGRNAKLDILRKHKDNGLWKNILVAMYDDSINYYVSAPSDNTFTENDPHDMFDILWALRYRKVTGNKARNLAKQGSKAFGEIFRLVLKGSLNCGVSIKTINAAYPCLIPTFEVMLAEKNKPKTFPVWSSIKYDGVRVVATVWNGDVKIQTRSGKILNIASLKNSMAKQEDGVYDGELVMGDGLQISRTGITGEVNRVLKGTSTEILGYTFCIFDKLTTREWDNQSCTRSYAERSKDLIDNFVMCIDTRTIRHIECNSHEDIESMFQEKLALGYEGLILRYMDDPYEWRRTKALMKVKSITTGVLRCVGTTDGTRKYDGMIGALICEGTINGKNIEVHVGTGLSDFDRDMSPEAYIDHDIEVEYNDIVKAKNADHWSLFLPVFKRILGGI